jgi:hypothetical protein
MYAKAHTTAGELDLIHVHVKHIPIRAIQQGFVHTVSVCYDPQDQSYFARAAHPVSVDGDICTTFKIHV